MKAPANIDVSVLILFFNRPDFLQKVFDEVKKARPTRLFLYQDGPRGEQTWNASCSDVKSFPTSTGNAKSINCIKRKTMVATLLNTSPRSGLSPLWIAASCSKTMMYPHNPSSLSARNSSTVMRMMSALA